VETVFSENFNIDKQVKLFQEKAAVSADTTAWQSIARLMEQKAWSKTMFCNHTLLDQSFYYKAKRSDSPDPSLEVLMAICAGMDLEPEAAEDLLHSAGFHLGNAQKKHIAYRQILTNFQGQPLHVRNEFLRRVGVGELGSGNYTER
jgi:hypothetical protein